MNLVSWINFYLILITMSISSSNWLSMWTILEISSWIMLVLMISDEMDFSSLFKMYIMFSIISIILLTMWMTNSMKQQWILLLFSFKMAMPPCHWWLSWIMKDFKWKLMWWFTTIHKFIPMMFSIMMLNYNLLMTWCVFSTILSAMLIWMSNSIFNIIFFSSCMHSNWMWISTYDQLNFLMYFIMYSMLMYIIFYELQNWNFFQFNYNLLINMILILGFPTSLLFFLKLNISNMLSNSNPIMMWIILLTNILMIYPYSRLMWITYNNNFNSKFLMKIKNKKINILMMTIFQYTIWPVMI